MMGSNVLPNLALFITETIFSLYALVLLLRALLTFVRADFYNPLSQFIFRLTEPPLSMLRTFLPAVGRVDLSCWLLAYIVKIGGLTLLVLIQQGAVPLNRLFTIGLLHLAQTVIHIYIFALIIIAISSWFISPVQRLSHPLFLLLQELTEPLLRPVRQTLTITGPIDFSIMIVLFGLYALLTILRLPY